jgi:hypothetical protein
MTTDELTPNEIAYIQEWRRQRALWDKIDLDNPRTDPPPMRNWLVPSSTTYGLADPPKS